MANYAGFYVVAMKLIDADFQQWNLDVYFLCKWKAEKWLD